MASPELLAPPRSNVGRFTGSMFRIGPHRMIARRYSYAPAAARPLLKTTKLLILASDRNANTAFLDAARKSMWPVTDRKLWINVRNVSSRWPSRN